MAAITTANGVNATKFAALVAGTGNLKDLVSADLFRGTRIRVAYDTYEFDGDTMAAAGVLTFSSLPKGAIPLGFFVSNSANSAAATADLQFVDPAGNITQATASEAWTSMNGVNQLFIPCLEAVQSALDDVHKVTVTTAAQTLADGLTLTVGAMYIARD